MLNKIKALVVKSKGKIQALERSDFLLIIVIVLISITAFGLGRISATRDYKTPIEIQEFPFPFISSQEKTENQNIGGQASNTVKASINGTKYYYSWCSGLSRIKPENIIEFTSSEEAKLAGYELAAGCSPR